MQSGNETFLLSQNTETCDTLGLACVLQLILYVYTEYCKAYTAKENFFNQVLLYKYQSNSDIFLKYFLSMHAYITI